MTKQYLILVSGIALLQCSVCLAGSNLFENVGPDPRQSASETAMRSLLPALPQQAAAGQNEAPGLPVLPASAPAGDNEAPGLPVAASSGGGNEAPGLPVIAPPSFAPSENAAAETPADVMNSLNDQYRLGPGDTIVYQVIEDQDPPTNLVVTDSGELEVPYYGLVHAAGKTCQQLAAQIKTLLQKNLYYQATVVIALGVQNKKWVTGQVYVTGQVKNPGSYPIPSTENMTVSKAILAAGGFSDFSDQKHVRLIRPGADGSQQTSVVNVVDVWKGDLSKDLPVQPGDTVVVPAKLINY